MRQARVIIVQPYLPEYRWPVFEAVTASLAANDVALTILVGSARGPERDRGDQRCSGIGAPVRTFQAGLRGRSVRYKPVQRAAWGADLVISELGSGALESYLFSLRPGVKHAVWGHVYSATTVPNRLDAALERVLMRRAERVFAYTEGGGASATAAGVVPDRVTVLNNTIDTRSLADARRRVTPSHVEEFRRRLGIGSGPVGVFIGGLDSSKRLDFLLEAAKRIASVIPEFCLVIAGDGMERKLIESEAVVLPWLRYIGRADDESKALLGAAATLILNPGRVGLISVDSFALSTPIATTRWPFHAPEFEYLANGINALITEDRSEAYVGEVTALLLDRPRLETLRRGCDEAAVVYTLESMVDRFVEGIMKSLG